MHSHRFLFIIFITYRCRCTQYRYIIIYISILLSCLNSERLIFCLKRRIIDVYFILMRNIHDFWLNNDNQLNDNRLFKRVSMFFPFTKAIFFMRILFKFIFIQVLNFEHDTDNFLSNSFRLDGYTKLVSLPQKSSIKFFLFHFFLLSTFMSIFFYLMINDEILLRLLYLFWILMQLMHFLYVTIFIIKNSTNRKK